MICRRRPKASEGVRRRQVFRKMDSDLGVVDSDLNISLAVVASEPDISQLMEDLETITKEKEDLLADNLEVSKTVLSQQEDFQVGQRKLREQLELLEQNTQLKEKALVDLQRSHSLLKERKINFT